MHEMDETLQIQREQADGDARRRGMERLSSTQDPQPSSALALDAGESPQSDCVSIDLPATTDEPPVGSGETLLAAVDHNPVIKRHELAGVLAHLREDPDPNGSASLSILRPGSTWTGADGTAYDVVRSEDVADRPRWWIPANSAPHEVGLLGDPSHLHSGEALVDGSCDLALVLHDNTRENPLQATVEMLEARCARQIENLVTQRDRHEAEVTALTATCADWHSLADARSAALVNALADLDTLRSSSDPLSTTALLDRVAELEAALAQATSTRDAKALLYAEASEGDRHLHELRHLKQAVADLGTDLGTSSPEVHVVAAATRGLLAFRASIVAVVGYPESITDDKTFVSAVRQWHDELHEATDHAQRIADTFMPLPTSPIGESLARIEAELAALRAAVAKAETSRERWRKRAQRVEAQSQKHRRAPRQTPQSKTAKQRKR